MTTGIKQMFTQALGMIESLNNLSLEILELLQRDSMDGIEKLTSRRAALVEGLAELDSRLGDSRCRPPQELSAAHERLLLSGRRLSSEIERRLDEVAAARRRNSLARTTARGYRPRRASNLSTRRLES